MAAVKFLLCFLCLAFIGSNRSFGSRVVTSAEAARLLKVAAAEVGVRELTGNNDGPMVEEYLAYSGLKKGNPWCAAWVSWCFGKAGWPAPRSAWSPSLFPQRRAVQAPEPGLVFGIYYPELKRIAHCGIVERTQGDMVHTLEGNTNPAGSREGQGVYRRLRHRRSIAQYAKWFN
ncbi:peptidoglycan-binding protein [Pedobacter faecalis]|uniref:peptidoglycan-binding protein n=1 Tax=Pedobacter faecalis TaxID=3041495 RepID=UPI00254D3EA9|nr:peptidoglycan-binding protein [Pedobacter sp. ELA7]